MRCPHCGKENPPQARFCAFCGRAPETPTPARQAPSLPKRRHDMRLFIAVGVLILLLGGSSLAFVLTRRAHFGSMPGVLSGQAPSGNVAAVLEAGKAPGEPGSPPPPPGEMQSGTPVTGATPGNIPNGRGVTAANPGNLPNGQPLLMTPGGYPQGPRVNAAYPGNRPIGPSVTTAQPGNMPAGQKLTAAQPGNMPNGQRVNETPPGNIANGPKVNAAPAQPIPSEPSVKATPLITNRNEPPRRRGPDPRERNLVAEYLRRLEVVQARDNQLNQQIGNVAGGMMLPGANALQGMMENPQGFFNQYGNLLQSFRQIALAKQSLGNQFLNQCGPIARICPPVQNLHQWYIRYFNDWIQTAGGLHNALQRLDLGAAMQVEGMVQRAENTERQAQREEDRLRDHYDIPQSPYGPR